MLAMAHPFTYTEKDAFWYLYLTPQQEDAYQRFHEVLRKADKLVHGVDDKYSLLRFLKARQWDVEKAKVMYLKMAEWRVEHNVDALYETIDFTELQQVLPHYPHFYQ